MKIEIEIENVETAAKAINNATIAFNEIVRSIILGCEVPYRFQPLTNVNAGELQKRLDILVSIYNQICEYEGSSSDGHETK